MISVVVVVAAAALTAAPGKSRTSHELGEQVGPVRGNGGRMTEVRALRSDDGVATRGLDVRYTVPVHPNANSDRPPGFGGPPTPGVPMRVLVVAGEGATFVEVTGEPNLLPLVQATLHDGMVSLRTTTELLSITGLLIVVHLPKLTRLLIDGDVSVDATLQSDSLDIVAAGKPALTLTGRARHLNLALGGNSKVAALDLEAQNVTVEAVGDCDVQLNVAKSLTVRGKGTGSVAYSGRPDSVARSAAGVVVTALDPPMEPAPEPDTQPPAKARR